MGFELKDTFETTDGSVPDADFFPQEQVGNAPLSAFRILAEGDAFDGASALAAPTQAAMDAWLRQKVTVQENGCPSRYHARVRADACTLLGQNPRLLARLQTVRPIVVELVPIGAQLADFGFPAQSTASAAGIFWNQPEWSQARIGLREEWLDKKPALVAHELAHAVHYLCLSKAERDLIYQTLRPTFGSRQAMDEVFAIYAEHEFLSACRREQERTRSTPQQGTHNRFGDADKAGPGVYGFARRQWDENHLFTRFMRKLFYPNAPLAGPRTARGGAAAWKRFLG